MSNSVAIGLTQLVLWYDSVRIQAWPVLLSQVPDELTLPSATDFGRRFDTGRMTDTRHAAAEKIVRNLPGLERKKRRLTLKGVGLLELSPNGYKLSSAGQQLKRSYLADPRGKDWVRVLGRLLLLREPRTRVLLREMSQPDSELVFDGKDWFSGSIRKAYIENCHGRTYPFVGDHPDSASLRTMLRQHSWWGFGEWRHDPLLAGAENCHYTGTLQEALSLHDVSLALRGVFELLFYLELLIVSTNRCRLDTAACAREFGKDMSVDFGWSSREVEKDFETLLLEIVKELRSDTGYVVASELRHALQRVGVSNPDAEIGRLQSEGRLVIEAEDYGQSRHGEGLFGDPRKQMIQIRLLSRSHA